MQERAGAPSLPVTGDERHAYPARILDHYVERTRAQEDYSQVTAMSIDKTAALRGHDYITLLHDLATPRLIHACEGRNAEVVGAFADDLDAHGSCADNIKKARGYGTTKHLIAITFLVAGKLIHLPVSLFQRKLST